MKLFGVDFPNLEKKRSELVPKLQSVKTQIQELEKRIKKLSSSDSKDSEYELICRAIKTTKSEIELIQQAIRELQVLNNFPCTDFLGIDKITSPNAIYQQGAI